jgi:PHD/YefM family antitoxin component YafN of YafNO toxin-antitoxin module
MSIEAIYSEKFASVSELKKSPSQFFGLEEAVAILRNNRAEAYLVPSDLYAEMMEKLELLEDMELAMLAEKRLDSEEPVQVDLDDL